ncbi:MAG: PIN domain-containing protein [Candidatus Spechtbacteria bacterium]|nr:PIN domain-containing protein [Candidatus Spechtbacteria bacterium]
MSKIKEEDKLRIFQLDPALLKETEKVMLRFGEHKLSFTDASIVVVAKAYYMNEIFTLDKDFRKVGLQDAGIAD